MKKHCFSDLAKVPWFLLLFVCSNLFAQTTITLPTECSDCKSSSNGTAIVNAYGGAGCTGNAALNGTYAVGQAVTSANTMTLYANVTQVGSWNITTAANNGVTFSGSGTFATTGCQPINLNASGTPTTAGLLIAITNTTPQGTAGTTVQSAANASSNGTAVVANYGNSTCAVGTVGTINGTLTQGVAVSGVTMSLYANVTQIGSWSLSASQNGVTFTGSGTFTTTGCQLITLTGAGTPTNTGSTTFTTNSTPSGSATANVVAPLNLPANLTLGQNKSYFVASVNDNDYLPYTAPTVAATTATGVAADGGTELLVNVQGVITTTGITINIPCVATGTGTLPAYSQTVNVPANLTEDGISRSLTLEWASQSYSSTTRSVTATIKSVAGSLNVKKLDINAGIGNDVLGVLLGSFSYPYNSVGNTTTYQVRAIAGIPDKKFGIADNTGSTTKHQFLYLPMLAEDGNIWLNNNLGAMYADVTNSSFNLAQQATSATDFKAYGSLFQWGRNSDGHELVTWTSGTTGTVTGTVITQNNNPSHALYIPNNNTPGDWRVTQDDNLWATESSANNPCPFGFRLPLADEYSNLITSANILGSTEAFNSTLKLTTSGARNVVDGGLIQVGARGYYQSGSTARKNNDPNTAASAKLVFYPTAALVDLYSRVYAHPVRCIKN